MTRKILFCLYIFILILFMGNVSYVFAGFINVSHWDDISKNREQANSDGWSWVYGGVTIDSGTDTPDGPNALKFTYYEGHLTGTSPDKVYYNLPYPVNELWFQYYFKYSNKFPWNDTGQKMIYVYTPDSNYLINSMWEGHDIHMLNQINFGPGTQPFASGASIDAGRWYKLKVHSVMNTVGKSDGIIQVWLNDNLIINKNSVMYRNRDVSWDTIAFDPTYGGGGTNVPSTGYLWIDFTIVSTEPIGDTGPVPPPSSGKTPTPPSSLKIGN